MKVLLTGAAGFIGFHTAIALLERGIQVVGLDNLNDYYDVNLKRARLSRLTAHSNFCFAGGNIADRDFLDSTFKIQDPTHVINLAAQAGVRYSIENPRSYVESNLVGFLNILEGCRHHDVQHLVYASSSSVYGANTNMPFSVHNGADHPLSLYAASKKSNEMMAHAYSHLYGLPTTGLRFFTVYGPWGRPDMSLFLFVRNILAGEPIKIFNNGNHARDFTYIDDIVDGILRSLFQVATADSSWTGSNPDPATSQAPFRIYNLGNNQPVELMYFIKCIEEAVGRTAKLEMLPLQPGDVPKTCADIETTSADLGFSPKTPIEQGIKNFVEWYSSYYNER